MLQSLNSRFLVLVVFALSSHIYSKIDHALPVVANLGCYEFAKTADVMYVKSFWRHDGPLSLKRPGIDSRQTR